MWDSNMTDEYFVAVKHFNLSWPELCELGRNSLRHSFLQSTEKNNLLQEFEDALSGFESAVNFGSIPQFNAVTYGYGSRHLGLTQLAGTVPTSGPIPVIKA